MIKHLIMFLFFFLMVPVFVGNAESVTERGDWATYFAEAQTQGTFVLYDLRKNSWNIFNTERAKVRFIPASTFKIPNSLIALENKVIKDPLTEIFPWDGVTRDYPDWNRDQTLRTAMKYSVVPVYQEFARAVGAKQMKQYLWRFDYGNMEIGDQIDRFWLQGPLAISALEQIQFLVKLFKNALPVSKVNQLIVKDILINEASKEYILRAKTGLGPTVGWWVGWVEKDGGVYFFACNINLTLDRHKADRTGITRAILQLERILP